MNAIMSRPQRPVTRNDDRAPGQAAQADEASAGLVDGSKRPAPELLAEAHAKRGLAKRLAESAKGMSLAADRERLSSHAALLEAEALQLEAEAAGLEADDQS
jgi:hypothetical protein